MKMLESIAAFIDRHHLFPPDGEIIVAVSGGADSLCLLHLLHRLCGVDTRYPTITLRAAHLNHCLRGEASAHDAAAVASLVAHWNIPFTAGEIDVPALAHSEHRSIEEAARLARYRFLREIAQGQPIAVAHHADDQVETLLLHYLRGSGLSGMVGMLPRQRDIIRPLLEVSHAETVAYCQQHSIEPLEDLSNTDPTYTRNRIRHQLLPMLESINAGFRATLLRSASVMRDDFDYIESQVDSYWPQLVISEQEDALTLHIETLLELPLSLQRHVLRRVAEHLCEGQSPLELRHYALIERLLQRAPDRQTRSLDLPQRLRMTRSLREATFERLPYTGDVGPRFIAPANPVPPYNVGSRFIVPGEKTAGGNGDTIYRVPTEAMLEIPGEVGVPGTGWIGCARPLTADLMEEVRNALRREDWTEVWRLLPVSRYVVYVDAATIGPSLSVRTRRPGDRLQPLGMSHSKKVQDMLVDHHVPRAERDRVLLFFSPDHCVWLAGICLDERVRLTSETERILRLSIVPASELQNEGDGHARRH